MITVTDLDTMKIYTFGSIADAKSFIFESIAPLAHLWNIVITG